MLKKNTTILILLFLSVAFYYIYSSLKIPDGVVVKGAYSQLEEWLSLGTSILTFVAAIIGLILKLIELKSAKNK